MVKLDFGCGANCKEGFEGVDFYYPKAKHKINLFEFPFPWEDNSIEEINCSHFVEHIPKEKRWPFFEECYRILQVGKIITISVPNWKSERAYGDNTHEWPPFNTMSIYYLNKKWREDNKLTYGQYNLKCDFDFNAGPNGISPIFAQRAYDAQIYAVTHYMESYSDMWCVLTKK
jgi:hypothetical protein